MGSLRRRGARSRLADELYTCCAFWIAVSALPALALSYVVVRVSKHLWLKLLSSRYPGLEFIRTDTVRSLLDTHRNQGIINVLLSVKGTLNAEDIKNQLNQHVIERRDRNGELMFPRMRHLLVSCWGNYAWDAKVQFRTENHFMVANGVYRGRPVTDSNIEDYISEIVSKYFPSDQPPWQYIVIPCLSPDPKYFILVRVHHLLLTGKKSINIGDLLLMQQIKSTDRMFPSAEYYQESPLAKLFPTPSAIPELWEKINENLCNAWNEFISEYDPVESPRALKTLPGAFHVAGLMLISSTSALRELMKRRSSDKYSSEPPITATSLLGAIQRECKRRNLTVPKILLSPLVTMDPRKWPRLTFGAAFSTAKFFLKLPLQIRDEVYAIKDLKTKGHVPYSNTLTWKYAGLAQLWARAVGEVWDGLLEGYRAPAMLWSETVGVDEGPRHLLQTVPLCGRKVASWSKPVSRASVERAARALGVSSTDIALFGATEALRAFFEQAQSNSPDCVLVTARAATEDFLFTFAEGDGKKFKKSQTGGMVMVSLPVGGSARRIADAVRGACGRQRAAAAAWAAQARGGTLTRALPSPLARLTLNLLSKKYAVSYAEITAPPDATHRLTVWGQKVDYVVYWRPPQANISMSLTVIQYADTIRLSVMSDARLSPGQTVPARRWSAAVDTLVNKVDQQIARIAAQSQTTVPTIIQPVGDPTVPTIVEPVGDTTSAVPVSADDDTESEAGPSRLLVPTASSNELASPPPIKRRLTHH